MSRDNKFYGKRRLCQTNLKYFDKIQRLGSDQLYKRYNSVEPILQNNISKEYQDFLAQPDFDPNFGTIVWHGVQWQKAPRLLSQLEGEERAHYEEILQETLTHYQQAVEQCRNEEERMTLAGILSSIDERFIYCYDDRVVVVAWGMREKEKNIKVFPLEELFVAPQEPEPEEAVQEPEVEETPQEIAPEEPPVTPPPYSKVDEPQEDLLVVAFNPGLHGRLDYGASSVTIPRGGRLDASQIPTITPESGYLFTGWDVNLDAPIQSDIIATAQYRSSSVRATFNAGEHGLLKRRRREVDMPIELGSAVAPSAIPRVKSKRGYRFTGWSPDISQPLSEDTTFTAQYEQNKGWWYSWYWWRKRTWWEWLLWGLLFLLLLFLILWLLGSGCSSCASHLYEEDEDRVYADIPVDSVGSVDQIRGDDGSYYDDNGRVRDILGDDDCLPDGAVVAPIMGDDGRLPRIIDSDEQIPIIADRLNVYLTDDNANLQQWVKDFKGKYPSDNYCVIGIDPNAQLIQIQVPSSERESLGKRLPQELPRQPFFVVDEAIVEHAGTPTRALNGNNLRGWHLKAVNAPAAWQMTKGSPEVIVAVIDDGIDASHPIFQGRLYRPYNVFTQNNYLSTGEGHGTHVAAIAAGSTAYYNQGAAGIAPNCKIMPVQVFDNGLCTISAMVSGIMYAVLHGADVVNMSLGPSGMEQFARLPRDEQRKLAKVLFKGYEQVFQHVTKTVTKLNAILVIATGNENVVAALSPTCRNSLTTLNVAAVNPDLNLSDFTNYDQGANIAAPGVAIYSATPHRSFESYDGTSMASPIVAGSVALMRSTYSSLTAQQALYILRRSGYPIEHSDTPMIQIDRALILLKQMVQDGSISKIKQGGGTVQPDGEMVGRESTESSATDSQAQLRARLSELQEQQRALQQEIDNIQRQLQE